MIAKKYRRRADPDPHHAGRMEWRRGLLMQLAAGAVAPAIIIERV